MPMKAALCLMPLALAACNSQPEVSARNATVEEVAEKVRDASGGDSFLRAGKWLTKATIEEMSAPGMPPGIADNMIAAMAKKPGTESCMTEADVKKPRADFFGGNKNCRYDHFEMGNGAIDAKMRCSSGGGTQVMTMAGDYKPDEYHMRMTTEMERGAKAPAGGMGSITMKMRVEGKRIGDCDDKTA
jgi:hypothetical protein